MTTLAEIKRQWIEHGVLPTEVCRVCCRVTSKKCGGCAPRKGVNPKPVRRARYCSKACQVSDWSEHKKQCPRLPKVATEQKLDSASTRTVVYEVCD